MAKIIEKIRTILKAFQLLKVTAPEGFTTPGFTYETAGGTY